jgi:exodeoxyribonuclease VII small subunit
MADLPPDIAAMTFEDALAELDRIVRALEGGSTRLDDAIAAYERGALLKRHCDAKLAQAQARVERIVRGADGALATEPANIQ